MTDDWYRNQTWNEAIASRFFEKLKRARQKEQYLRIQASILAQTHPEVALDLLDRYFTLPDDFDHAQAYVDRATALRALGRTDEAIASLENALSFEDQNPRVRTNAYLDLPFMVATNAIESWYGRARELLDASPERLMFPIDHFRWHAAKALIAVAEGDGVHAKQHAKAAIEASERVHSGFRYHPDVGLVDDGHSGLLGRLSRWANA